nr:protein arabidillo 1 [Quercus suber]
MVLEPNVNRKPTTGDQYRQPIHNNQPWLTTQPPQLTTADHSIPLVTTHKPCSITADHNRPLLIIIPFSVAIGREGGVAPLIALARSESEDVHETAAGALWNLAFNPGNALRIVEEGGVPALVHLCSSSQLKVA